MTENRENKIISLPEPVLKNPDQARQAYIQAQKLQQAGYLSEAEKLYRQILAIMPGQSDTLHNMGMLYMQYGNLEQARKYMEQSLKSASNPVYLCNYGMLLSKNSHEAAIQQYKKALQLKPDYAEAWFNLGVSYASSGQFELAEDAYKKAVTLKDNYLKALYNLAYAQEMQSKTDEAALTIEKILSVSADSAEVHNTLGAILVKIGRKQNLKSAAQHFIRALTIRPDYIEAYVNLGSLYEKGNKVEDSIKCYSKALELEPGSVENSIHLADALIHANQYKDAETIFSRILQQHPAHARALCGLGDIKRIAGDFASAEQLYEQAMAIDLSEARAFTGLAACKKFSNMDNEFIDKLKKLAMVDFNINFTLGKIFNDMGDYDAAFERYNKANEARNEKIDYNPRENAENTEKMIQVFTNEFLYKLRTGGNPTELPVFIVGTPRSGTTLTEQILSSHPDVFGAGELSCIFAQVTTHKYASGDNKPAYEYIQQLTPDDIAALASDYLEKIKSLCGDRKVIRITDKMPGNFHYLGYIASLFPNARLIHCKRHALDACLSIYFQNFNSGHGYKFDLKNLGLWYKDYLALMDHWHTLLGNRLYSFNYEDTVYNMEESARNLLAYCGLEWSDNCLQFHETKRAVKTSSQWQVRQPVYTTSLERWKRYDKHIGPLKEILAGYY